MKRGTTISLYLTEESNDFLEQDTVRYLIKKYSQFVSFNIYLWGSSPKTVDEPIDEDKEEVADEEPEKKEEDDKGAVKKTRKRRSLKPRRLTKPLGIGSFVTSPSPSGPGSQMRSSRESTTSSTSPSLRTRTAP